MDLCQGVYVHVGIYICVLYTEMSGVTLHCLRKTFYICLFVCLLLFVSVHKCIDSCCMPQCLHGDEMTACSHRFSLAIGSGNWTRILKFGRKRLYLRSHLLAFHCRLACLLIHLFRNRVSCWALSSHWLDRLSHGSRNLPAPHCSVPSYPAFYLILGIWT